MQSDTYYEKARTRLLSKTVPSEDGCLIWSGSKYSNGYGCFSFLGKNTLAHRTSYLLFTGGLTPTLVVDHICRNKDCVNPEHLRQATQKENCQNVSDKSNNSNTGFRNVRWRSDRNYYEVDISSGDTRIRKSGFLVLEDAVEFARSVKDLLHTGHKMEGN